jgi:hypothetical protein
MHPARPYRRRAERECRRNEPEQPARRRTESVVHCRAENRSHDRRQSGRTVPLAARNTFRMPLTAGGRLCCTSAELPVGSSLVPPAGALASLANVWQVRARCKSSSRRSRITMARIRLIGLTMLVAVAISAVASASAFALQWLLDGKQLAAAVVVNSAERVLLGDLAAVGGARLIECNETDRGTVGPGTRDETTERLFANCTFQRGGNGSCEAAVPPTARALHLPYRTTLILRGGRFRDTAVGTGGPPGWRIFCRVAGVFEVEDECTSLTLEPEVVNLAAGVGLRSLASETFRCSEGTSTSGVEIGTDLDEDPKGQTLSVGEG